MECFVYSSFKSDNNNVAITGKEKCNYIQQAFLCDAAFFVLLTANRVDFANMISFLVVLWDLKSLKNGCKVFRFWCDNKGLGLLQKCA